MADSDAVGRRYVSGIQRRTAKRLAWRVFRLRGPCAADPDQTAPALGARGPYAVAERGDLPASGEGSGAAAGVVLEVAGAESSSHLDVGRAQIADLIVHGGYTPQVVVVQPGVPIVLRVDRQAGSWCSERLLIPSLGLDVALPVFERTQIPLPALAPGDYPFTCGMEMLEGVIRAADVGSLLGREPRRGPGPVARAASPGVIGRHAPSP